MPTRSRRATPRSSTCEAGCDVEVAIRPSRCCTAVDGERVPEAVLSMCSNMLPPVGSSLDRLVSCSKKRWWNGDADYAGGLAVDHQFKFRGLIKSPLTWGWSRLLGSANSAPMARGTFPTTTARLVRLPGLQLQCSLDLTCSPL